MPVFARTLLATAVGFAVGVGCTTDDEAVAPIEIFDDGSIVIDDQWYESAEAFHRSPQFKAGDHRCGTQIPLMVPVPRVALIRIDGIVPVVSGSVTGMTPEPVIPPARRMMLRWLPPVELFTVATPEPSIRRP